MSDVRIKLPKKNEEEETYACRECGLLKLSTEFRFKNKAKGILHPGCKDCIRKRDDARTYNYGDTKKCTGCKNVLPIDDFGINRAKTGQRKARCRDCVTLFRNKIKRSETDRDRYHNRGGREKAKVSYEKYKPKRNANRREKTKNDPQYRLDHNYRTRIYHALRQNGQSRTGKIKYLGMSQDIYNQWLEYQFDENMTRDNYGTYWEIDHVKPECEAKPDELRLAAVPADFYRHTCSQRRGTHRRSLRSTDGSGLSLGQVRDLGRRRELD